MLEDNIFIGLLKTYMNGLSRATGSLMRTALKYLWRLFLLSGFSLILCLMLLNPVYGDFTYSDFSSVAGLDFNGDAVQSGNIIILVPDAASSKGTVFHQTRQVITNGFKMKATLLIGTGDSQPGGLAFLIQNDSAGSGAICGGCIRGFAGLYPAWAVTFTGLWDATLNGGDDGLTGSNLNAIEIRSNDNGTRADKAYVNMTNYPSRGGNDRYIFDGVPHVLYIDYTPGNMDVYFDDMVTPKVSLAVDLNPSHLNLVNGGAFIGFSAGSGATFTYYHILDWYFKTGGPFVLNTDPANMEIDVLETDPIIIYFSEDIDPNTWDAGTVSLKDSSGNNITGTISMSGSIGTFNPDSPLQTATSYTMILDENIESLVGNLKMDEDYTFWFYTRNPGPFYVDSANGLDSNPGTWGAPFQTIERAIAAFTPGYSNTAYCTGTFWDEDKPITMSNMGGTAARPWVIRNWTNQPTPVIDRNDTTTGIHIKNASNIIVQGFEVVGFDDQSSEAGIHIEGSQNITLLSNVIDPDLAGSYGVRIEGSRDILLADSRIDSNREGVQFFGTCENIVIRNCEIFNSAEEGIIFKLDSSVNNITIQNSDIVNSGSHGVRFDKPLLANNITIQSSYIQSAAAQGIYFDGTKALNFTIQDSELSCNGGGYDGIRFMEGSATTTEVDGFNIYNTKIHGFSQAIEISSTVNFVNNLTISNCEIYDSATGIKIDKPGDGYYIYNNHIYGISTYTIDTSVALNDVKVIGNFIYGGTGLTMEGGVENLIFQSNIIVNSTGRIELEAGGNNFLADDIANNVIVMNASGMDALWITGTTTQAYVIRNNVISGSFDDGMRIEAGGNGVSIRNNIIIDLGGGGNRGVYNNGGPTLNIDYNNIRGVGTRANVAEGPGGIDADPQFLNTTAAQYMAADFYRLNVGFPSPCIDAGDPGDIGLPGVMGTAIDMGAFESSGVIPPAGDLDVNKYSRISYQTGTVASLLPGYTVIYSNWYSNSGVGSVGGALIRDGIPSYLEYAGNENSPNGFVASFAVENPPVDQTYGSAEYDDGESTSVRWVRWRSASLQSGDGSTESGALMFSCYFTNATLPAGSLITNISTATGSSGSGSNSMNVVTVGTLFGGRLSQADDLTNYTGLATIWTMFLTNKGNIDTVYTLTSSVIRASNSQIADWSISFSHASLTIPIGNVASFTVSVTPLAVTTNGAWIDFDIIADTGTAQTNYVGDNTVSYGGDIGETNNGNVVPSMAGMICQQNNNTDGSPIRLWRIWPPVVLSLSKSISNVTLGGLPIAGPVPGSTVAYSIYYSNAGGEAQNMIIYDQLPSNAIYFSNTPWSGWGAQFTYDDPPVSQAWGSLNYTNMPPPISSNVRWIRWTNSSVADSETGLMIYSVIIK